jgi:hypothetical protein
VPRICLGSFGVVLGSKSIVDSSLEERIRTAIRAGDSDAYDVLGLLVEGSGPGKQAEQPYRDGMRLGVDVGRRSVP